MDESKNNVRVIDISTLAYDLNAITDFIFQRTNKGKTNEIREIYEMTPDGTLKLLQKEMTENKNDDIGTTSTIRYDLIRSIMERANNVLMDDYDINDTTEDEVPMDAMSAPIMNQLGDTFAINTLLREGMLVNMNLKENSEDNE